MGRWHLWHTKVHSLYGVAIIVRRILVRRWTITFREATSPITGHVTKFGGQPSWLTEPVWPLSASTGEAMRFIGQVALDPVIFGDVAARMAYLFITDPMDDYVDETWDANSGENAVVLQPGTYHRASTADATGPSLYRMVPGGPAGQMTAQPCEFEAILVPEEESDAEEAGESGSGNKVGGKPWFIQGPEYPDDGGTWRLLLQLDSTTVPFYVNFGDAGIGYAFLSDDGERAGFLWQCA